MNLEADADLLREFINESGEHLQNIELGVLTLEENPTDKDTLNSIFRAFHTFKGGSGFLNLLPMKNLAHELESAGVKGAPELREDARDLGVSE